MRLLDLFKEALLLFFHYADPMPDPLVSLIISLAKYTIALGVVVEAGKRVRSGRPTPPEGCTLVASTLYYLSHPRCWEIFRLHLALAGVVVGLTCPEIVPQIVAALATSDEFRYHIVALLLAYLVSFWLFSGLFARIATWR